MLQTMSPNAFDLIPIIQRARGYRVYDIKGKRYLDLYQDGGHAILGHRPDRVGLALKNTISKGLLSDYPSVYTSRFVRALTSLLPGHSDFRWYCSTENALAAASQHVGRKLALSDVEDPVFSHSDQTPAAFWRPFLKPVNSQVTFPLLPLAKSWSPTVVAFRERPGDGVLSSDCISGAILSGMCRSVYDLIRYVGAAGETDWERFNSPAWDRKGPYLLPKCDVDRYGIIFERLLQNGIIISPFYPGPSILPGEYSPGEIKRLMQNSELEC